MSEQLSKGEMKYPGLDFCYEGANAALLRQLEVNDSLARKALSLLGFDGLIIAALIALSRAVGESVLLTQALGITTLALLGISAIFCVSLSTPRTFKVAPSPKALVDKYLESPTDHSRAAALYAVLEAWKANNKLIKRLSLLFFLGGIMPVAAAMGCLIALFVVLSN